MYERVTLSSYPCASIAFLVVLTLANSSSCSETEIHHELQDYKGLMTIHHLLHTNTKMFS